VCPSPGGCGKQFKTRFKKRKIFCSVKCKKHAAHLRDRELAALGRRAAAGLLIPKPVSPGRPKLAPGKTRIFGIGQAVEQFIQPARMALKIIARLPSHERGNPATLRAELLPLGFRKEEISLAQFARTAKQLSRRVVAMRENMTEASVTRCHQAYISELGRAA
jgi:hypothetical protein